MQTNSFGFLSFGGFTTHPLLHAAHADFMQFFTSVAAAALSGASQHNCFSTKAFRRFSAKLHCNSCSAFTRDAIPQCLAGNPAPNKTHNRATQLQRRLSNPASTPPCVRAPISNLRRIIHVGALQRATDSTAAQPPAEAPERRL
jgi:hypothetical protein